MAWRTFRCMYCGTQLSLYKVMVSPVLEQSIPAWTTISKQGSWFNWKGSSNQTDSCTETRILPWQIDSVQAFNASMYRRLLGGVHFRTQLTKWTIEDKPLAVYSSPYFGSITRGHSVKLVKPRGETSLRQRFFTQCSIDSWNPSFTRACC